MKALTQATAARLKPINNPQQVLHVSLDDTNKKFILTFKKVEHFHSTSAERALMRRFSEHKELDTWSTYEVHATDNTVAILEAAWPSHLIEFEPDARIVYEYWLNTITAQELVAQTTAEYKELKRVPSHSLELHPEIPLAEYQVVAAHNALQSEGFGLFMEQGTGKTPTAIATICATAKRIRAEEGRPARIIVVCPRNVRNNWLKEMERFSTECGNVEVLRGGELNRMKVLIDAFRVDEDTNFVMVICSYESLDRTEGLKLIEWDIAIADEGHYFKNPTTKRFKHMMELRDRARRRITLTGTPITNSPLDLYSQFEFMGEGFSGFANYKAWRSFYGVFEERGNHTELVGCQNLPFMQERLARLSFITTKAEALPYLPEKVYDVIDAEMTPEQADIYKQVAEQLAVEIESDLDEAENKALVINNVLTKMLRLGQITSGFVKWDPVVNPENGETIREGWIEYFNPSKKIEALIETLKEKKPTEKTIVWSCWIPSIHMICEALDAAGIKYVQFTGSTSEKDRIEAERQFNFDDDCKVFVGNPAAGGTGLNLLGYPPGQPELSDCNANHVIYFAQNWSPTSRWQSEDRAHRKGTRENVRISDLCVANSIDELIRTRVLKKKEVSMLVSDVREILRAVLNGIKEVSGD